MPMKTVRSNGVRASSLVPGGSLWYTAGGAGIPYVAYAAKGAASLSASYVNLANPGTLDLTGATPTWNTTTGWTSSVQFTAQSYISVGGFSAYWRGVVSTGVMNPAGFMLGTMTPGWDGGMLMHSNGATRVIFVGANTDLSPRFGHTYNSASDFVACYVKKADNSQALYINGAEVASSPKAGTAYSSYSFFVGTGNGGSCKAVAIYRSVHDSTHVAAVSAAMAAL